MEKFGCEIVSDCDIPSVDVVFVHGLRGDRFRSWTTKANTAPKPSFVSRLKSVTRSGKTATLDSAEHKLPHSEIFWPRDLLAPDIPNARIIMYGYDGDVSTFMVKTADNNIFKIGHDLITRLEVLRSTTESENIPIIFIAHSLGGIIVKDALKFSEDQKGFQDHLYSIYSHAYGIIFFGTPHRGSEMASLGRIAARTAGLGIAEADQHLLRSVELGSPELERIADSFSRMLPKDRKGLNVYSFQEGLPLTGLRIGGKVVEDWSSIIGDAREGKATIHANHMNMCRFNDKRSSDYQLVLSVILRWTRSVEKGKGL
jgi:hypothetical protein